MMCLGSFWSIVKIQPVISQQHFSCNSLLQGQNLAASEKTGLCSVCGNGRCLSSWVLKTKYSGPSPFWGNLPLIHVLQPICSKNTVSDSYLTTVFQQISLFPLQLQALLMFHAFSSNNFIFIYMKEVDEYFGWSFPVPGPGRVSRIQKEFLKSFAFVSQCSSTACVIHGALLQLHKEYGGFQDAGPIESSAREVTKLVRCFRSIIIKTTNIKYRTQMMSCSQQLICKESVLGFKGSQLCSHNRTESHFSLSLFLFYCYYTICKIKPGQLSACCYMRRYFLRINYLNHMFIRR